MNIDIKKYNPKEFSKLLFIYNAIEDGWKVKKQNNLYLFSKPKSKEKCIYNKDYLENFLNKYLKNNN